MSNKGKNQQQSQQQQQTQQQLKNGMGPIPPRYQPPPAPKTINHHHIQAARLANQVKDAVQSKFPLGSQQPRMEKPGQNFGYHPNKAFIASPNTTPISAATGIPTLQGSSLSTTPTTPTSNTGIPMLSNGPSMINHNVQSNPTNTGTTTTTRPQQQRLTDDDFLRLGPIEMLKFVRKTENDMARLANEHHRQVQALLNEIRVLKEANQRLSDDSQELRDLCCFLDDDRQKGRKLAREWQRFGRYTASVMRQEVSAYQNKLRQLDNKQQELIKDNLELKELCLYLDEERGGSNGSNNGGNGVQRDDGDGSSSSTNADENNPPPPRTRHISTFNDQMMQYVRSLEQRINQLEEDKTILQSRTQGLDNNTNNQNDNFHLGNRPEAVVRALQVLEVREQLEREAGHDEEKALVREMCNVVWRKLEEGPNQNRH